MPGAETREPGGGTAVERGFGDGGSQSQEDGGSLGDGFPTSPSSLEQRGPWWGEEGDWLGCVHMSVWESVCVCVCGHSLHRDNRICQGGMEQVAAGCPSVLPGGHSRPAGLLMHSISSRRGSLVEEHAWPLREAGQIVVELTILRQRGKGTNG